MSLALVDPYDLLLIGVFAVAIISPILGARAMRRAMQRYLPGDADIYTSALPGQPFVLDIPPGPALEVMIRYRSGARRHGLTVLVEATRDPPERGFREGARPFELRHERVLGTYAKPIGEAPVAPGEMAYAIKKDGLDAWRTSVLARLPAGGAGVVRGRIEITLPADDFAVFAKPC
jgi:hypothetical protein